MRYSPFWNKRRGAVDVASIFPAVNVSQIEALSLMKLSDTHVAAIEALSLLKLSDTHVAGLEVLTLLKTSTLVNTLVDKFMIRTGARAAQVSYRVDSDGYIYNTNSSGVIAQAEQWLGSGAAADYDVRFTQQSNTGVSFTATFGSWLDLTSDQAMIGAISGRAKYADASILVEIRDKATTTVQESCTVFIELYTDGGLAA